MRPNLSWLKKSSKSKTPDSSCHHGCQNQHVVNSVPQPSTLYTYQLQPQPPPQPYHQHQTVYQPPQQQLMQQPIHVHHQLSTCPLQTCQQPQQHIIQSPQQSVSCPIQSQHLRNGTLELVRPVDNGGMVLNNHTMQLPPSSVVTMPAQYHSNQIQTTISSQSPQCPDNPYYSNQVATLMLQQQQQQQQIQHHQQLQHQHQQHQLDEQRQKQHQQQLLEQQMQMQHIQHQHQHQQQQHQHYHQQIQQQPQQFEVKRQPIEQQQQQYQNHQVVNELANGDGDFSLEVLCIMHEQSKENLNKLAGILNDDLKKLSQELEVIRKETPVYSVNEAKI